MTKKEAKKFAEVWIGNLLWEVNFKRESINCPDEDKDLIQSAIQEKFFKLMGKYEYITPQAIYDLITEE